MSGPGQVTVEFYGIPRQRAGCAEMSAYASTPGELLRAVQGACPQLSDLLQPDGRMSPSYLLSIDGVRFVQDLGQPLEAGTRMLLLSADAGG